MLTNDTDADGDKMTITHINGIEVGRRDKVLLKNEDGEKLGWAKLKKQGEIVFHKFKNVDQIDPSYTVSDGKGGEDEGKLTVGNADSTFRLSLLHFTDQEAGARAVEDAPRLSAVLNALRDEDVDADATLAGLISGDAAEDFAGTAFPQLSANLDFSTYPNLAPLAVAGGQAPLANTVTSSVVLLAHMQQLPIERALAPLLENVDIIIAGGSNTRLLDENDRLRDGDTAQGQYPIFIENAAGTTTAIVNADGSYKYVGRLVVDFDADGNIISASDDADVSGAYATDAQGVADLGAEDLVDPEIQQITDSILDQILAS